MKKQLLLVLFLVCQWGFSQKVIVNDSLSIELKKVKEVSKRYNMRVFSIVKSKKALRILTRCYMKALYKQPVDINAFCLLDTKLKLRYRIAEYVGYKKVAIMNAGYTSKMYLKKDIRNNKGKPYRGMPKYDAAIKDSFNSYIYEGYRNVSVPMHFGSNRRYATGELFSKKKELKSVIYYDTTNMKRFTAEIYFVIDGVNEKRDLELYYGYQLISKLGSIK
ncbi:MAG: hypothetical protein COB98_01790 [Flavobacteriaceae bacterium]|nr:MAG: hypothetical protein COB98_01790 [Flavobacteriaceae bacterium]